MIDVQQYLFNTCIIDGPHVTFDLLCEEKKRSASNSTQSINVFWYVKENKIYVKNTQLIRVSLVVVMWLLTCLMKYDQYAFEPQHA